MKYNTIKLLNQIKELANYGFWSEIIEILKGLNLQERKQITDKLNITEQFEKHYDLIRTS